MMGEEGSKKKKKKRGRSLIFNKVFRLSSSDNGTSSGNGDKVLASDDNLVYCDVTTANGVDSDAKKPSSSRGRMSRIFRAVLFESVMKKKKKKKSLSSIPSSLSVNSSPVPDEKIIDKSIIENDLNIENNSNIDNNSKIESNSKIENNLNIVKSSDPDDSSSNNDRSSQFSLSSKATASPVASPRFSSINTSTTHPQILTERKVTSRVESMDKKPPLPSIPRPPVKQPIIPARKESKTVPSNHQKVRLCLLILLSLFITVLLWMIYAAIAAEPSESDQYTDVVIAGDEL